MVLSAAGLHAVCGVDTLLRGYRSTYKRADALGGPQVLGRTQPNGDSLLSVSAVVDGIVTFEDLGDAERFAALLEADGIDEVPTAQPL